MASIRFNSFQHLSTQQIDAIKEHSRNGILLVISFFRVPLSLSLSHTLYPHATAVRVGLIISLLIKQIKMKSRGTIEQMTLLVSIDSCKRLKQIFSLMGLYRQVFHDKWIVYHIVWMKHGFFVLNFESAGNIFNWWASLRRFINRSACSQFIELI